MTKSKEDQLIEYTQLAMKGLVMGDEEIQYYKVISDVYMIAFDEAVDKGKSKNEAHIIATNILTAMLISQVEK